MLNLGLAALAAGAFVAWIAAQAGASPAVMLPAAAAASALAARAAARALPGPVDLTWNGQAWAVDGDAGVLDIAVDAGSWMLLRLRPPAGGRVRWVPVSAAEAGAPWHALRVAAFATAGRAGDDLVAAATGAAPPGR